MNYKVVPTPRFKRQTKKLLKKYSSLSADEKAQIGLYYAADFDYLMRNGWYLSSGFNVATFDYYEPPRVANPSIVVIRDDGTNGTIKDRQIKVHHFPALFK